MMIVRVGRRTPYLIIPKATVRDPALSIEARGFLAWLLTKPDNWCFYATKLAEELEVGRNAVGRLLGELVAAGYASREPLPWKHGSRRQGYEYTVRDFTVHENEAQPKGGHG